MVFGNFDKLNAPYYLVSDFWVPVAIVIGCSSAPKMVFHFSIFRKPKISLAPQNTKNGDVPKFPNGLYLAKSIFFVTILSFVKCVVCPVLPRISDIFMQFLMSHDILGAFFGSKVVQFTKDWTFWRVPKTGCFFILVLYTKKLCVLWRTERFGWQKICIFCTILTHISILY